MKPPPTVINHGNAPGLGRADSELHEVDMHCVATLALGFSYNLWQTGSDESFYVSLHEKSFQIVEIKRGTYSI